MNKQLQLTINELRAQKEINDDYIKTLEEWLSDDQDKIKQMKEDITALKQVVKTITRIWL